ncbi:putative dihydroxyacetone kinase [Microthyrium microscopicum]|uniref:Putative dihydroxyacetone kinase n=1 Tax=Microthyrium microscopicum TaxID=703497 RepID=A0A6A6UH98_9PEZI|nr:putative dihydroxyacetone kinase [Microthyrium microscopicum]
MASSNRHFISDPTHLITTALHSHTLTNPSLTHHRTNRILSRPPSSTVGLISGGGSGHEPSFAGFVGEGLLSASVAGSLFASPSAEQVSQAIRLVAAGNGGRGVCVVVMNYTGDVLNFGLAVEKAKARGEKVELVVVGDDVGVGREQGGKVGRRGIAGTCLVLKIVGALAGTGADLESVVDVARLVAANTVSIGASLAHVHVPGRDESNEDDLKSNEVELGMGIHNEAGSARLKDADLPTLVKTMLAHLLDQSDKDRAFLKIDSQDSVVLMINNLGGVSVLEMGGIATEVADQLEKSWKIKPVRVLVGTYMTSLNGLGFSISLLKVMDTGLGNGKSMIELLDSPAEAIGWSAPIKKETWTSKRINAAKEQVQEFEVKPANFKIKYARSVTALTSGLRAVIKAEPDITNYDTVVGDGDCGIGLKRGAEGILEMLKDAEPTDDIAIFLDRIIQVVESAMDGTSGALYAIFLNTLAQNIRKQSPDKAEDMQLGIWAKALEPSLSALGKYTPAKVGDRTLVDALEPFISTLSHYGSIDRAAQAAATGAEKTKSMKASLGRSVYVSGERWDTVPDPGAYGLAVFLQGLADGLK